MSSSVTTRDDGTQERFPDKIKMSPRINLNIRFKILKKLSANNIQKNEFFNELKIYVFELSLGRRLFFLSSISLV